MMTVKKNNDRELKKMLKKKSNLDENKTNNDNINNNNSNNKNLQQINKINKRNKRIDNLEIETSQLSQSVEDSFNYQIEQLQKDLDNLQTTTEEEFETIYCSLDNIDEQLEKLKELENLKNKLDNICNSQISHSSHIVGINKKIELHEKTIGNILNDFYDLNVKCKYYDKKYQLLKKQLKDFQRNAIIFETAIVAFFIVSILMIVKFLL